MKKILCTWIIYLFSTSVSIHAQELLPKSMTKYEKAIIDTYLSKFSEKTLTNPPNFPVRTMAEWEEIKAISLRAGRVIAGFLLKLLERRWKKLKSSSLPQIVLALKTS